MAFPKWFITRAELALEDRWIGLLVVSRHSPSLPLCLSLLCLCHGSDQAVASPSNNLLGSTDLVNLVNRQYWVWPHRACPRSLWLLSTQLLPKRYYQPKRYHPSRYYPSYWFLPWSIHCPLNLWPYLPHWHPNEEGHGQLPRCI